MTHLLKFSLAALLPLFSLKSFAADFGPANALFAKRGDGASATAVARDAYSNLLPSLSGSELIFAASRIAQLDIYSGEILLPKSDKEGRKAVFARCFDDVMPKIAPSVVGETPNYYYWRGTCLAFWAEAATLGERLSKITLMKQMIAGGLARDTRYYGGGIFRLYAGITSNPLARAVGLYNPEDALVKVNTALAAANYPGDPHNGASYYANYHYKVETLKELGRTAEAREVADLAIQEIEELESIGALPQGLEPETRYELSQLREFRAGLGD